MRFFALLGSGAGRLARPVALVRSTAIALALVLVTASITLAIETPLREETRPDQRADLVAKTLSVAPAYPAPGERTQVRLEVENRTNAPIARVQVFFFAAGKRIGTATVTIGAYAVAPVSVPWTPSAAGTQTLSAIVDPRQVLTERDRSDNSTTIDVAVAPPPPKEADFAVVSIEVLGGEERARRLRVVVANEGSTRGTAPLIVRRNGIQVFAVLPAPIDRGGRATIKLPWGFADDGQISAEINPRHKEAEPRKDNNALAIDPGKKRAERRSDLRITDVSLQTAHLEEGRARRIAVSFRIVNDGQAITQRFRTHIEGDGIKPFDVTTGSLAAGGEIYVSHMIEAAPSAFTLTVTADVDKAVAEADENNNRTTKDFHNPPDIDRWVSIGPRRITGSAAHGYGWNDAIGRLSAIAINPAATTTMYVGAQTGGAWKTIDGGINWQPIAESATVRVAALALAPDNPSRLYLVTPSDGVLRSDDEGTSWLKISSQDLDAVVHGGLLNINPANTSQLLVASNRGIYRSVDGGATWQLTLGGGNATGLIRLPADANAVFAAIFNQSNAVGAGVFRSADGGATWAPESGCATDTLPASDANTLIRLAVSGNQVFASFRPNDPKSFTLFLSKGTCVNGGVTDFHWGQAWSAPDADAAQKLWSGMWADPTNSKFVYLGGTDFWRSTNAGASFEVTAPLGGGPGGAHSDHHGLGVDPQSANVIYTLNDGGIYRSNDRGAMGSFAFVGDGITNVEFYDQAVAPREPGFVIGGLQDNGTIKTTVGNAVWDMIAGGDGATVDFDWNDPKILYSMGQYASSIRRSDDGGATHVGAASGLPTGAVCFNLHFQTHQRFTTTLLASCNGLWRSGDSGASWSSIFTPPDGNGVVVRSAIDAFADVYYAGTSVGTIFRGPAGAGWTNAFAHPSAMGVTDIEVDEDNRTFLYASFGGAGAGRVFRLATTSPTFVAQDITSDLPVGRAVKTIAIDRNRKLTVYAGTDRGVFRGRSLDNGATWFWRPYTNGMPPEADVRELEVHPGTGIMRAATFGRSAFEVITDHAIGSILVAEGLITFLRVHDVGTGFGPPFDSLDAEVIVKVDTQPLRAFGFQLRNDGSEAARRGMLDLLRDAFKRNKPIHIEYVRTGLRHGVIFRVVRKI